MMDLLMGYVIGTALTGTIASYIIVKVMVDKWNKMV